MYVCRCGCIHIFSVCDIVCMCKCFCISSFYGLYMQYPYCVYRIPQVCVSSFTSTSTSIMEQRDLFWPKETKQAGTAPSAASIHRPDRCCTRCGSGCAVQRQGQGMPQTPRSREAKHGMGTTVVSPNGWRERGVTPDKEREVMQCEGPSFRNMKIGRQVWPRCLLFWWWKSRFDTLVTIPNQFSAHSFCGANESVLRRFSAIHPQGTKNSWFPRVIWLPEDRGQVQQNSNKQLAVGQKVFFKCYSHITSDKHWWSSWRNQHTKRRRKQEATRGGAFKYQASNWEQQG